jgi:hypothetical protein
MSPIYTYFSLLLLQQRYLLGIELANDRKQLLERIVVHCAQSGESGRGILRMAAT